MESEFVIVVLAAFALGALPGFILSWLAGGIAALVLFLLLAGGAGVLILLGQGAQGWDGLAYVVGAVLLLAPAALGAALAGWLGARLRWRKRLTSKAGQGAGQGAR